MKNLLSSSLEERKLQEVASDPWVGRKPRAKRKKEKYPRSGGWSSPSDEERGGRCSPSTRKTVLSRDGGRKRTEDEKRWCTKKDGGRKRTEERVGASERREPAEDEERNPTVRPSSLSGTRIADVGE
ncbi:hypothetical protein WN55_00776 [Dufourea novaeangliae]|uniref:Uncharacterized protein n=1 Tax=Dufourea novaeangliae TaxID=178035 RepID=A0A154PCU4_DUFNO|nr:hypothetical protein WN55_00776 [Dufourea novaeangliae]